jgi:methionyl-tRNA synthetase
MIKEFGEISEKLGHVLNESLALVNKSITAEVWEKMTPEQRDFINEARKTPSNFTDGNYSKKLEHLTKILKDADKYNK